jgi:hypothetical protein
MSRASRRRKLALLLQQQVTVITESASTSGISLLR